jgi:hypothetical protein
MYNSTIIKSAHDGTILEFFDRAVENFKIRVCGSDFHGTALVYSFEPRPTHLAGFFRDLAMHWRGWPGKKEWASLEGEFALTATCDSTGHTSLLLRLRSGPNPFDWCLSVVLLLEAGQLESIASQIEYFVGNDATA